jgi:streptogramin lyase
MRSILGKGLVGLAGAALLTAMTSALFASAPPAVPKAAALTGKVSSTEEGLMEGVVVSAKKEGSTITVSVVSNVAGQYSFPADRLTPGKYTVTTRATGYDMKSQTVEVTGQQPAALDLKVSWISDQKAAAAQMTSGEWFMTIPGTYADKQQLTGCVDCHTLWRPANVTYNAADMAKVLVRMGGYYPPNSQPDKIQLLSTSNADTLNRAPTPAQVSFGKYVASFNLSTGPTHPYPLQRLPRPTGKATEVIMTTYDLPRQHTEVHDVLLTPQGTLWYSDFGSQFIGTLDPKTGKATEYEMPIGFEGRPVGALDIRADKAGKIYVANMGQAQMTIFDPKTGKFDTWIPPDWNAPGDTRITMLDPLHDDVDGKVWVKSAIGVFQVDLKTLSGTKATAGTMIPTNPNGETRGYGTVADNKNNVFHLLNNLPASTVPYTDAKTLQTTYFQIPSGNGGCRRGHVDAQNRLWCAQSQTNRILMVDPQTKEVKQIGLKTPWQIPYDAQYDDKAYVWTAGMAQDLAVRVNVATGEQTEYLLPAQTNIRKIQVDSTTPMSSLWVGDNFGGGITHVEPLTP